MEYTLVYPTGYERKIKADSIETAKAYAESESNILHCHVYVKG